MSDREAHVKDTVLGKFMAKYVTITPAVEGEGLEVTVARHDQVLGQLLLAGEDGFARLANMEDMMATNAATLVEHGRVLDTVATKDDLATAVAHITVGDAADARRKATAVAVVDELVTRFKSPGSQAKVAGYVSGVVIAVVVALKGAGIL
jgi:hypothetical protein